MMMSASRTVSSTVALTATGFPSCSDIRAAKRSRDSGRLLVTRISSKPNSRSSIGTLYQAVPRAPMCPSTRGRSGARCLAPTAVTAPVRIQVMSVPSRIANGAPVSDRYSVISASSDGSPKR